MVGVYVRALRLHWTRTWCLRAYRSFLPRAAMAFLPGVSNNWFMRIVNIMSLERNIVHVPIFLRLVQNNKRQTKIIESELPTSGKATSINYQRCYCKFKTSIWSVSGTRVPTFSNMTVKYSFNWHHLFSTISSILPLPAMRITRRRTSGAFSAGLVIW